MAGYSDTPLARKLGIKEGARVGLIDAPEGFEAVLGALPEGVAIRRQARGPLDVLVFFTTSRAKLTQRLRKLREAMDQG